MTTLASETEHLTSRPNWVCRTCAMPWPCAEARAGLLEEFRGFSSVLTIYMNAQMHDAASDLMMTGTEMPPNLYERFLAWIRQSPTAGAATRRKDSPRRDSR